MDDLDKIRLAFDPASLRAVNAVLALVMFGVALDMRLADFAGVLKAGRGAAVGLGAQFFVLPAFTYALVLLIHPPPAVALGMILVAACPGGNMSNFLTHHAKGDTALSVAMTGTSTAASLVMTPFNLALWGGFYPETRRLLREVSLDPVEMAGTVVVLLGIPLAAGMLLAARLPAAARKLRKPMNRLSLVMLAALIALAVAGNFKAFHPHFGPVAILVALHNGGGLALGYAAAKLLKLDERASRAISLEVGMQNSALGLILIFNHFDGNGGMAVIAAWWGVWHLISGLALSSWWRGRPHSA